MRALLGRRIERSRTGSRPLRVGHRHGQAALAPRAGGGGSRAPQGGRASPLRGTGGDRAPRRAGELDAKRRDDLRRSRRSLELAEPAGQGARPSRVAPLSLQRCVRGRQAVTRGSARSPAAPGARPRSSVETATGLQPGVPYSRLMTASLDVRSRGHRRSSGSRNPDVAQQFRDGLQRVDMPGWIINHRGMFVWLNEAFIELFGDRVGEHYSSVVAPEHRGTADLQFARKLHGTPATDYEVETVTRDGERLTIDVSPSGSIGRRTVGPRSGSGREQARPPRGRGRTTDPRQLEILGLLARRLDRPDREAALPGQGRPGHVRDILQALGAHSASRRLSGPRPRSHRRLTTFLDVETVIPTVAMSVTMRSSGTPSRAAM